MTKEEFRKLSFRNIDDVVKISNEECCYAFCNVYKLDGDCVYGLIMARLKKIWCFECQVVVGECSHKQWR